MSRLFDRQARLVVAKANDSSGLDVKDLAISFDVKKTLKPTPNVAKITIRNLTRAHRAYLETAEALSVELHAGYEGVLSLIYLGEMSAGVTSKDGKEYTTTISSGDKRGVFAGRTLRVPIGPGGTAEDAIRILAQAFANTPANLLQAAAGIKNVGLGNLEGFFAKASASGSSKLRHVIFPVGGTLSGKISDQMTAICNGAGIEWSIQDGLLVLLEKRKPLDDTAVLLSSSTGLVGSVAISNKGYIRCKSLLIPELQCGKKMVFDVATGLKGQYRIESTKYKGDSYEHDWYVHLEGSPIK